MHYSDTFQRKRTSRVIPISGFTSVNLTYVVKFCFAVLYLDQFRLTCVVDCFAVLCWDQQRGLGSAHILTCVMDVCFAVLCWDQHILTCVMDFCWVFLCWDRCRSSQDPSDGAGRMQADMTEAHESRRLCMQRAGTTSNTLLCGELWADALSLMCQCIVIPPKSLNW